MDLQEDDALMRCCQTQSRTTCNAKKVIIPEIRKRGGQNPGISVNVAKTLKSGRVFHMTGVLILIAWTSQATGGSTVDTQTPQVTKCTKFTPGELARSINSQPRSQWEEEENKGQSNKGIIIYKLYGNNTFSLRK